MKIKDIREALEQFDDDLEVRLVADHGQTAMTPTGCRIGYIEEDVYMAEEIHPFDIEDEHIKVVILEAF